MQRSVLQRMSQPAFLQLAVAPQRDFAVSEKQLRIRMKSVNSIRKITKAMKMVSASKMKADLARLHAGREFGCNAVDMIFKSDQFMQRKMGSEPADPSMVIVPITSDKGLCGAVNSTIVREVKKMAKDINRGKTQIFSIGEKGTAGMARPFPDMLRTSISQIGTPYNYPTIMAMAVHIAALSKDADKVTIIYNEFKSAISYIVRHMELLPQKKFLEVMRFAKLYE